MKQEPIADYQPLTPVVTPSESNKLIQSLAQRQQTDVKKGQRESMISIRKDYSYKYNVKPNAPSTPTLDKQISPVALSPLIASPSTMSSPLSPSVQSNKKEVSGLLKVKDAVKRSMNPLKPLISILERHDYDKGPSKPKLQRIDNNQPSLSPSISAISSNKKPTSPAHPSHKSHVPIKQEGVEGDIAQKDKELEHERLKVVVAQPPIVKQEQMDPQSVKAPMTPSEQKDSQNINKINNKINIIFQLNDNTKSLRKNIILHRRAPKKMVQKITIKETNNNMKPDEVSALVPDRVMCSIDTQTETFKSFHCNMSLSSSNPLNDEPTEHLFFEDNVLISLQRATISFFDFNRLGSLLKKGEADFKLIDRIPRRLHDTFVDSDNKYQRLCYNDHNSLPIYVEMRAKQKELDDPDMCPIAFLYCNVYYIDQRRAKFSSVHLDTVKSVITDIIYTTVPGSSYFIMAWAEKSGDLREVVTGIVKYKLTPNLDLAKLASIRQFPKLNYRAKQMNCGKGKR